MNSTKLSVVFLNLFIISFPLSVTLSQSFAVLSIFSFLFSAFRSKTLGLVFKNSIFLSGFYLYLGILPALIWNFSKYSESIFSILLKSETSDVWMSFLILPAFYHIKNLEFRKQILISLFLSSVLIVMSGFISTFTPFRLAPFIRDGFSVREGVRLQHFAGDFYGRFTYLPIGLMNTHLTFGGLCGLLFPGISLYFVLTIKNRGLFKNILIFFHLVIFAFVIFYNQSRSIWLGILFTIGLIGVKLFPNLKIYFSKGKYLLITLFLMITLIFISTNIYKKNWLLQRAFQESLADNTTENQRYFIYKNTFLFLKENWVMGVGPGRFSKAHQEKSNLMIEQKEQLWYELYITPRQHAHHDLLHFLSIGGIFGLTAFLYFWFQIIKYFIKVKLSPDTLLFSGILVLFIAGFFQCYLLDDEVTLPFFALVGFFTGSFYKEESRMRNNLVSKNKREKVNDSFFVESISLESSFTYLKKQMAVVGLRLPIGKIPILPILVLLIPILFSLFYIFYKTRLEPEQVYRRKVTVSYPELRPIIFKALKGEEGEFPTKLMTQKDNFRVEGCLSHRFSNPIRIRKEPFQFVLELSESAKNPPTYLKLKVIERDSFDQDQLYKVHTIRQLGGEYIYPINPIGKTLIQIDDLNIYQNLKESKQMPENIYFRDFELTFTGFDSKQDFFTLPSINLGKLCDSQ